MVSVKSLLSRAKHHQRALALLCVVTAAGWAALYPQRFMALWLTPDQQGWLLFERQNYNTAARRFSDPRWRGMSLYAAQDFAAAAQYFSQYQDAESLLARGNALAHAREYLPARAVYEELARRYPQHPAPAVNIPIVQALIDANREMSQSQVAEAGDMAASTEDGPKSSEGDERPNFIEREQLSAAQLLEDPALTDMWLRQVQRDPSEFLSTKFYMQLQQREGGGQP